MKLGDIMRAHRQLTSKIKTRELRIDEEIGLIESYVGMYKALHILPLDFLLRYLDFILFGFYLFHILLLYITLNMYI